MAHQIKSVSDHPIIVLQKIIERYGTKITFEFSVYKDLPGINEDDRDIFTIPASIISEDKVVAIINNLPENKELALNSRVLTSTGDITHIPMVDFSTGAHAQITKLSSVLPKEIFSEMLWFNSGRSFHGYGITLISPDEWVHLMGRLLLTNRPGYTAIVDPRWIGHRLMAGYSALRWSRNTPRSLNIPKRVINIAN